MKTNKERLTGLLYKDLEDQYDYYKDRIKQERYLAIHSGNVLGTKQTFPQNVP